MKKRVILVGKAASGKDYARKICEQWFGLNYAISYTTRPPREEEVHGRDYFFLTEEEFRAMIVRNEWYEYVEFNGWCYGTTKVQMEANGNVFIMTPKGMSHLSVEDRRESIVIYFEIDEDIRRSRMNARAGNADSVERRIEADRIDFELFANYDHKVTDPFYKIRDLYALLDKSIDMPNKDKFFHDLDDSLIKKYNISAN